MSFTEFKPPMVRYNIPIVKIDRDLGRFSFNSVAIKEFDIKSFQRIILLYNSRSKTIGISFTNREAGTIKLSFVGPKICFYSKPFITQYEIETGNYICEYNEEDDVIELKKEGMKEKQTSKKLVIKRKQA